MDINITEIIINQLRYGTMDKEELRKKVDVMYMCSAFSTEDYKKIVEVYKEVTTKDTIENIQDIQEHNEEVVAQ